MTISMDIGMSATPLLRLPVLLFACEIKAGPKYDEQMLNIYGKVVSYVKPNFVGAYLSLAGPSSFRHKFHFISA